MNTANQGNIADARQYVARLPTVDEKVQMLTYLSPSALARNDRATARELLASEAGGVRSVPSVHDERRRSSVVKRAR